MSTQVKPVEMPHGIKFVTEQTFPEKATFEKGLKLTGLFEIEGTVTFGTSTKRLNGLFGINSDFSGKLTLGGSLEPANTNVVLGVTRYLADVRSKKVSVGSDGIVGTTSLKLTTNASINLKHVQGTNTYDIYTTGHKPTWNDVSGNTFMTKSGTTITLASATQFNPNSNKTTNLGTTGLRLNQVWSETYRGKDVDIEGDYKIGGTRQPVIRSGTAAPDNSVGKDGDIYIKRA